MDAPRRRAPCAARMPLPRSLRLDVILVISATYAALYTAPPYTTPPYMPPQTTETPKQQIFTGAYTAPVPQTMEPYESRIPRIRARCA
jgi:hypothetical protein